LKKRDLKKRLLKRQHQKRVTKDHLKEKRV